MNKRYLAPQIQICVIETDVLASSATMKKTDADPITSPNEILTKQRPFLDDDCSPFGW